MPTSSSNQAIATAIVTGPPWGGGGISFPLQPVYHLNPATGVPDFMSFQPELVLSQVTTNNPTTVALAFFTTYPAVFGTGDPLNQLQVREVLTDIDQNPMTHVIFQQMYGGLVVWGCELRVHLSHNLAIRSISGNYMRDPAVSFEIKVPEVTARTTALNMSLSYQRAFQRERLNRVPDTLSDSASNFDPSQFTDHLFDTISQVTKIEDWGLVVLPSALARDGGQSNHLAWRFRSPDFELFVSASTGNVVYQISRIQNARQIFDANQGTNETLQLRDGVQVNTNTPLDQEALNVDNAVAAVEAFWRLFARNGWDGQGGNSDAVVDFNFDNPTIPGVQENSNWSDNDRRTNYSHGWGMPDVVGHEFTHALTHATSRLIYRAESGAMNESFSDVFGELIFPDPNPRNWLIGEAINTPNTIGPLRDMASQRVDRYSKYNTNADDNGRVHENSGIGNRAAVLISDGDGTTAHPGIGRQRLARLYWDVLTTRLHPWSTYIDLVHNTWEAVRNLVNDQRQGILLPGGSNPAPVFDTNNVNSVLWAFEQVELDLNLTSGWFQVPGNKSTDYTFFQGTSVPAGEQVTDAEITVIRQKDGILLFVGKARVSTGVSVSDPTGTITATITGHGVGGTSKEIRATVTTTDYTPVDVSATVYTKVVGTSPPTQLLPTNKVIHWFDNPFFLGRTYGDIIYEGVNLGSGCTVSDVVLELFDNQNNSVASQRFGEPQAISNGTGANIVSRNLGGTDLEVHVHSWHDFGQAVRYRLVYSITGNGCSLPAFTLREVGGGGTDPQETTHGGGGSRPWPGEGHPKTN